METIVMIVINDVRIVSLVGGEWLPSILNFPMTIGLLIIPIDEVIIFRGVAQPPTGKAIPDFLKDKMFK